MGPGPFLNSDVPESVLRHAAVLGSHGLLFIVPISGQVKENHGEMYLGSPVGQLLQATALEA